jgi:hypothetical protein
LSAPPDGTTVSPITSSAERNARYASAAVTGAGAISETACAGVLAPTMKRLQVMLLTQPTSSASVVGDFSVIFTGRPARSLRQVWSSPAPAIDAGWLAGGSTPGRPAAAVERGPASRITIVRARSVEGLLAMRALPRKPGARAIEPARARSSVDPAGDGATLSSGPSRRQTDCPVLSTLRPARSGQRHVI